eukprot:CAMPEP_0179418490 /NCGR_PEP_ID=MMETSP0799-20121207/8036_1 /TAXON_ID=46947 /ORGANISM="Geminigera cryophila, Strain CCMP2564" /LENGTH=108 /DNA_ID=CAMNT_0021191785 /DNA_START=125 /DNA_END=448 /DNA_ORIENTATION=+
MGSAKATEGMSRWSNTLSKASLAHPYPTTTCCLETSSPDAILARLLMLSSRRAERGKQAAADTRRCKLSLPLGPGGGVSHSFTHLFTPSTSPLSSISPAPLNELAERM